MQSCTNNIISFIVSLIGKEEIVYPYVEEKCSLFLMDRTKKSCVSCVHFSKVFKSFINAYNIEF